MHKWGFATILVLAVFLPWRFSHADGFFFPSHEVKKPDMPQQRAIIVYRNGVERLIIESAFQGESGQYAWVIPVPSEPLEIKKASYPLFKTMFYDSRQRVQGIGFDTPMHLIFLGLLALITLLWSMALLTHRSSLFATGASATLLALSMFIAISSSVGWLFLPCIFFLALLILRNVLPRLTALLSYLPFAFFLFCGLFAFGMGGRGINDVPGTTVVSVQAIGDYDVTTLRADNPGALDAWLTAGGFQALGQDGLRIAGDYIAEKWCFVVGKLRKADSRLSAPSPIEIAFKTDAPVYPMRLTSLSGGPLYVDLMVISDRPFECPALDIEFTSNIEGRILPGRSRFWTVSDWEVPAWLKAAESLMLLEVTPGKGIEHSESPTLLWDGCVVSKLSGSMTHADMAMDLRLKASTPGKYKMRITLGAAMLVGSYFALLVLTLAALTATIALFFKYQFRGRPFESIGKLYMMLLGLAAFAWIAAVGSLSIWMVAPSVAGPGSQRISPLESPAGAQEAFIASCSVPGGPAGKLLALYDVKDRRWPLMNKEMRALLDQIAAAVEPALREKGARNPITGDPIIFEESPGNLTIKMEDFEPEGRLYLTVNSIDRHGGYLQEYPKYEWK
ncbi:MAG: DUF2330 domain-containing protein [Candidatus Brocadiia bacterium]